MAKETGSVLDVGPISPPVITVTKVDRTHIKLLFVDESIIMEYVSHLANAEYIVLPVWKDLPVNCVVLAVHYVYERRAFCFKLYHSSFPPVPPGAIIPAIHGETGQTFRIELKK